MAKPKKVEPRRVQIVIPNDNLSHEHDPQAPYYREHYTEGTGEGKVKAIRNESFSHPRLVVEYHDGSQHTYVGFPFILSEPIPNADPIRKQETRL